MDIIVYLIIEIRNQIELANMELELHLALNKNANIKSTHSRNETMENTTHYLNIATAGQSKLATPGQMLSPYGYPMQPFPWTPSQFPMPPRPPLPPTASTHPQMNAMGQVPQFNGMPFYAMMPNYMQQSPIMASPWSQQMHTYQSPANSERKDDNESHE